MISIIRDGFTSLMKSLTHILHQNLVHHRTFLVAQWEDLVKASSHQESKALDHLVLTCKDCTVSPTIQTRQSEDTWPRKYGTRWRWPNSKWVRHSQSTKSARKSTEEPSVWTQEITTTSTPILTQSMSCKGFSSRTTEP